MFHFEVIEEETPVNSSALTAGAASGDSSKNELFTCGDRVYDSEKFSGTIKYVGSVGKFSGTWLGVEWDIPTRGKNNGSVDDKEYFKCSIPNSGSFIRPHKASKVHRLKEALEIRYGHQDETQLTSIRSIEDRLDKKKISYSHLRTLNLNSRGIESYNKEEDVEELTALCPNIEVLELANNLLSSWCFVGKLCAGFRKLSRIDLSKNPLVHGISEMVNYTGSFPAIDHVILGNIGYEWKVIVELSDVWPNLSNLQVPFNNVSSITPITSMKNVTRIDLERNKLTSWKEVLKLTTVERLEYLNLCGNAIENIRFPEESSQISSSSTSYFPNLRNLNVAENSIHEWISISELHKLKNLQELRIDFNPFLNKDTRANNRQLVIARLGKIQKLEGVEINRQERRDAEIDYVKRFCTQWKTEKDSFRFTAENPRYSELVDKWGESEVNEVAPVRNMKSSLIGIFMVVQPPTEHKECTKKVLATMTVQKLKGLIQRVFREHNPPRNLTAVSMRNPGVSFPLENDFADLATYSIEEGDKILITW